MTTCGAGGDARSTPGLHRGHVLGAAAFLMLPLGFYTPKGLAPLFIGTAIIATVVGAIQRRRWPSIRGRFALALGVFTAWAAASALWSVTPAHSLRGAAEVGVTALAGLLLGSVARRLDATERDFVERAIMVGGIVAFAALTIEFLTDAGLFRSAVKMVGFAVVTPHPVLVDEVFKYGNLLAIAALFIWVWIAIIVRRGFHVLAAAFGLFVLGLFIRAEVEIPLMALGGGMAAFASTLIVPRLVKVVLPAGLVVGALAAPWVVLALPPIDQFVRAYPNLSPSAYSRIDIWLATAGYIKDRPILGYGMDGSRALPGAQAKVLRSYPTILGRLNWQTALEAVPLHPHNLFLQLWVELGAIGALLGFAVLWALVREIASIPGRVDRALGYGMFATGLAMGLASFGAWQSWWLSALWLSGALAVASFSGRRPNTRKP